MGKLLDYEGLVYFKNKLFSFLAPKNSPVLTGTPTAPTASDGTDTTQIATTAFVQNAFHDALILKGTIGSSGATVSSLPAVHKSGWTYRVITAGTYVGKKCLVGDIIICIEDGTIATDNDWTVVQSEIEDVVSGPASSSNGTIPLFDGTTGKLIKDSGLTIETSVPANAVFTDTSVDQTATVSNETYEVLFSGTNDNNNRTEGTRKTDSFTYNPSTKELTTGGSVNGYILADAAAKSVDDIIYNNSTSVNLPTSEAVASFLTNQVESVTNSMIDGLFNNKWQRIQNDVRTLSADKFTLKYPIGKELTCTYTYNGTNYTFIWVVLDNNRTCEWQDGSTHRGLWLGAKYGTIENLTFDASEGVETHDTVAEEGYYYCRVVRSAPGVIPVTETYTMLELNPGDPIPSYNLLKGLSNNSAVYQYGSSRYRDSAIRQWLNSNNSVNNWWNSTHYGDNPPDELSTIPGFEAGLDDDFLSVVLPVKIQTGYRQNDIVITDTTYDRFFLPSIEEVYGFPYIATIEGPYFPYWSQATGFQEPSSNASAARAIPKLNNPFGNASSIHLRSMWSANECMIAYLSDSGMIGSRASELKNSALPICVIS